MEAFPILNGHWIKCIRWDLLSPHEPQAVANHGGQTLKRLAKRGGLSPMEAVAVLNDKPFREQWPDNDTTTTRERREMGRKAEGLLSHMTYHFLEAHKDAP